MIVVPESEGNKYWNFRATSKSKPGTLHAVSIRKDDLAGWCDCAQAPFRIRQAGKRKNETTGKEYLVGPAGTCRHIKEAVKYVCGKTGRPIPDDFKNPKGR